MRRLSALLVVACALLAPAAGWAAQPVDDAIGTLVAALEQGAPEELQTLAIWVWQDEKLTDPVRRAFRDDLEIALIQSPRFQYFHRERFRQILRERQLTLTRLLDPAAMKAVAAAGINGFLSIEVRDAFCAHPELEGMETHCVLLATLTDAATAAVVWAGYIEGTNPTALRALLGTVKPQNGRTRYRRIAQAVAEGLKASGLAEAEIKTITLSRPPEKAEPDVGIGIRNPDKAPFDLAAFQDELLLAVVGTQTYRYVDPIHIARLVAQWKADSEATAQANTQALAKSFALDGYLFGEIRSAEENALGLSVRLVSLKDGSEAWAGKFAGVDDVLRLEPREMPQPPVPREEPAEPEALTLEDIERPLKSPVPMPDLLLLPTGPEPPRRFNPLTALLYLPFGLPRDALDTTFLVADRIPLVGGATSALYRYGGIAHLTRLGTRKEFVDDVLSHKALTYGQLQSRDRYPTRFPLVDSAGRQAAGRSDYLLQISLGTLAIGDALDAVIVTVDRTPVLGTLATPVLLPLSYGWRQLPSDAERYVSQVSPGSPENRLTYGSLATDHAWSLLPNARSWVADWSTPAERREAVRAFAETLEQTAEENERRVAEWQKAETARQQYNTDALKTLRERNAAQRRAWEQALARVRRDNQTDRQRFERDRQVVEEHNLRAARINAVTASVFNLVEALQPRKPRPAPQPRPRPVPKPEPVPKPKPVPKPEPAPKPEPPKPDPPPKPEPAPAPRPAPLPGPLPAPLPAPGPAPAPNP